MWSEMGDGVWAQYTNMWREGEKAQALLQVRKSQPPTS